MNFNDPLHPSDLGLILTYRCTSGCAHCLYNCGPGWQDWMSAEAVRAGLENAVREWGATFQLHLTGGEAFLNTRLLRLAVQTAAELDIPVYAETSAAWCARPEVVEKRLRQLKADGLQALLVSCSPFHAEKIPLIHTLTAIEAGVNVFGPARVTVYQTEWMEQVAAFGVETPVPLEAYIERYGRKRAGRMFWEGYGLISGGRSGERLGDLAMRFPAEEFEGQVCRYEILYAQHAHFDLYGNFIPSFCGGISVGGWNDLGGLREAYRSGQYPALIRKLVEEGPFGLYELAARRYGYRELEDGYAGKCHLCVDARRFLAHRETFPELQPDGFYEQH